MNTLKRINKMIAANINHLLEKTEDPEKMIRQLIREMDESIVQLRMEVARAIAAEKRLARKAAESEAALETWVKNAERAVRDGDDELARKAIAIQWSEQAGAQAYRTQHEAALRISTSMKDQLRSLEDKIQEARRRKEVLIARKRRADAQNAITDVAQQFAEMSDRATAVLHASDGSMLAPLDSMEDQVVDLECAAEARREVLAATPSVARQADQAGKEEYIERTLTELKKRQEREQG